MRLSLLPAALCYLLLAVGTVNAVGVVGEVAIGFMGVEPRVEVSVGHPPPVHQLGPLQASPTRPTERLFGLPLSINAYTGGPADWPTRLVVGLLGGGPEVAVAVHVLLGLVLLGLMHRFLCFHASPVAAAAAAWWLASDWSFVFYRKVLGGTEILLQAAGLLVLWSLWSRRWRGGAHGTVAIALGVGLGLLAKITFVATLGAFVVAVLLTRWDRAALLPPRAISPVLLVVLPVLLVSPLMVANAHHALAGLELHSHDSVGLQLQRLSAPSPDRESLWNLARFFGNPLSFFHAAYGAAPEPPLSASRALGFGLVLVGAGLEWHRPARTAQGALLRFMSIFVPTQILLLCTLNRDLHHLAQSTVGLAIFAGLSAERLAATLAPPRAMLRWFLALLVVSPAVIAGARSLIRTDTVVASIAVPSFTTAGQKALRTMMIDAGVTRLVTSDYEVYGMLEVTVPEVELIHTWAAFTRRGQGDPRPAVLQRAVGGHYLSVLASAPMIYNWAPSADDLDRLAEAQGLRVTPVGLMTDEGRVVASLYRVEASR